jgi:cystathionine beta-lyase/cystathionine gamma-synthase
VKLRDEARFSTICIHAGQEPDPSTGAIITPIYQTSTYVQDGLGRHKGYEYARTQNPTRAALEANIAAIEKGKAAFAFASGMAAEGAVMTLLQSGDHVVVTDNTYGGTYRLFERVLRKYQLDFTYVDSSKTRGDRAGDSPVDKAVVPRVADQSDVAADRLARRRARSRTRATWSSWWTTRSPAPTCSGRSSFGADLVVHSTTKFLNGHSDSVGGIVVAVKDEHIEWLRFIQNAEGAILGPMDAWLVLRGTKTLPIRMERHNANAMALAQFLAAHPKVTRALPRSAVTPAARLGAEADVWLWRSHLARTRLAG